MAVIGRILLDYSELELDLMNCIQVAREYDLDGCLKAMFRIRGETNRVSIADGLGRQVYAKLDLEAEFGLMINTLKKCLGIRNKYAHAYWHDPDGGQDLCYVALEELAKEDAEVKDLAGLSFFYIGEGLLLRQEAYFEYARDLMTYLNYEGRKRSGKIRVQPFKLPAAIDPPPAYTRKFAKTFRADE
jgi:hypothetical protein